MDGANHFQLHDREAVLKLTFALEVAFLLLFFLYRQLHCMQMTSVAF